ncbi:DNA polymerase III subunit delta [Lagierella sp.]|uniref:DNA polymerase III subunit delta n=1 Tax=Lagierella sp. TaxID=2849657 RepID=UPI00262EBD71|nr:DNA polymerase III subunit delta [Lagierella sp.]
MVLIKNVIVLQGNENFLIEEKAKEIRNKIVNGSYSDFNVSRFDFNHLDVEEFNNSVQTLPLMSENKIVILDDVLLDKASISKFKTKFEDLIDVLKNIPDSTYVLLTSFNDKPFKGKFYKQLIKIAEVYTFNKLNKPELSSYICKYLNISIKDNPRAINFIVENSGYLIKELNITLYDLNNELDKIKNLNKNSKSKDLISTLTKMNTYNIFNLTDSILEKSINKSLEVFIKLIKDNEDPFKIFYMIVRTIRNILIVKEARRRGMNSFQISKKYSLSNFEVKKIEKHINTWTYNNLKEALHDSYDLEVSLKSQSIKPKIQLQYYIINLCN